MLGVDFGLRRIGVALSDESRIIASPLCVLQVRGTKDAARQLGEVAVRHDVRTLVLGLPLNLDGSEGFQSRQVRKFAAEFQSVFPAVELVWWDERLTTAQAERALVEAGVRRKARRDVIDKMAAAIILQSYLENLRHSK